MKIAFVLHDFSLTGAPKLGLQIAEIFAQTHQVTLITKKDGPLRDQIKEGSFIEVIDVATSHELADLSLQERVERATELLKRIDPDLVYVNSLAAGEWVSAASALKRSVVLHVHELQQSILELQRMRLFDNFSVSQADLVLTASDECMRDVRRLFRLPAERVVNFGVCVNIEEVQRLAEVAPGAAIRHDGKALDWSRRKRSARKLIVMCGQSSHRKGSDLFWQAAADVPEHDFLWVGPWDDELSQAVNPALALNLKKRLKNLYWTNLVKNPFAYISQADLFVLTAREDPNPLVVPEAISLRVPVVTFRNSGGSHDWTNRFGYSLTGNVDPVRIADFIHRFFLAANEGVDLDQRFLEVADLRAKARSIMQDIESLVSAAAA